MKVRVLPGRSIYLNGVLYRAGAVLDYDSGDLARKINGGVFEVVEAPKPKPPKKKPVKKKPTASGDGG